MSPLSPLLQLHRDRSASVQLRCAGAGAGAGLARCPGRARRVRNDIMARFLLDAAAVRGWLWRAVRALTGKGRIPCNGWQKKRLREPARLSSQPKAMALACDGSARSGVCDGQPLLGPRSRPTQTAAARGQSGLIWHKPGGNLAREARASLLITTPASRLCAAEAVCQPARCN